MKPASQRCQPFKRNQPPEPATPLPTMWTCMSMRCAGSFIYGEALRLRGPASIIFAAMNFDDGAESGCHPERSGAQSKDPVA